MLRDCKGRAAHSSLAERDTWGRRVGIVQAERAARNLARVRCAFRRKHLQAPTCYNILNKMGRKRLDELNARRQKVLRAVVQEYILTGNEVASERLVTRYGIEASPATVRNDLAWLTERGYLYQPHPSGGRIPTDEGYRFYVSSLGREMVLTPDEEQAIQRFFAMVSKEIDELYLQAARFLARLTSCLGVTVITTVPQVRIRHVDLVQLAPRSLLFLVVLDDGGVIRIAFETAEPLEAETVRLAERLLSAKLENLELTKIGEVIVSEEDGFDEVVRTVARRSLAELAKETQEENRGNVFIGSTSDIADVFQNVGAEKLLALLSILNEQSVFVSLAREAMLSRSMIVKIGHDNLPFTPDFSFVAAPYETRGAVGAIGVLGPKRMDYARTIAIVRDMSRHLSWYLRDLYEA